MCMIKTINRRGNQIFIPAKKKFMIINLIEYYVRSVLQQKTGDGIIYSQ